VLVRRRAHLQSARSTTTPDETHARRPDRALLDLHPMAASAGQREPLALSALIAETALRNDAQDDPRLLLGAECFASARYLEALASRRACGHGHGANERPAMATVPQGRDGLR
jgi:hypothetical protein